MADEDHSWYVDTSDPENPYGWTDDGETFAVYRKGLQWYPVTTRRRRWWEKRLKAWLTAAAILAAFVGWAWLIGALRIAHHSGWSDLLVVGPIMWGWGYMYGKSRSS